MVEIVKQDFENNKALFLKEKSKLLRNLGENVEIYHVGSTAIPEMYGKNIIDILIGVNNNEEFCKFSAILLKNGYFSGKNHTKIYNFFASKIEETGAGDIHIHLVLKNTERYNEFLILKTYLLNNENEKIKYSNFKNEILSTTTDRTEYRKIKSEYVSALLKRAKEN